MQRIGRYTRSLVKFYEETSVWAGNTVRLLACALGTINLDAFRDCVYHEKVEFIGRGRSPERRSLEKP